MQSLRVARRTTMIVLVAHLVAADPSFAAGLNLSWNDCAGEGGGVQNKQFACDTDVGTHHLVASIVPPQDIERVIVVDGVLEMISATPVLPPWWNFRDCRGTALFSDIEPDPNDVVCEDWSLGEADLYNQNYAPNIPPGTGRLTFGAVVQRHGTSEPVPQVMLAGHEYFVRNIYIKNLKTVGGECGGCLAPVCIVYSYGIIVPCDPNLSPECWAANGTQITTAHGPGSNVVTWQGATAGPFAPACIAATPAKRATWGAIKGLYR